MIGLRRSFFLLLVIILSFWTFAPVLHEGFFPMHDDTQPARVYEMAKALSFGQFPARWVGDLGYGSGYPLFNFYAPFPYYIGGSLNLLGLDALWATKIMFIVGILFAGISMFFLVYRIAGEMPALAGSMFYMYAPYHAVDIYVRGAVGEFYALAFLPLLLLGIIGIIQNSKQSRKKDLLIGSFGFTGVILSHNILGMVTGYFLVIGLIIFLIFLIMTRQKLITFKLLILTFILGISLSAFFILPALAEKSFTRVDSLTLGASNFSNHFVYLDQLWSSPWGYAGSALGRLDGMSFMVGKIHILLGLLSIPLSFYFYGRKKLNKNQLYIILSQLVLLGVSVFFMIEQSNFFWNLIPGFPFIQYPWRFLAFSIFSLSVIASMILIFFKRIMQVFIGILLIIAVIWFNSKYFKPQEYKSPNEENFISKSDLNWRISKISDEYLPKDFIIPFYPPDIAWYGLKGNPGLSVTNIQEEFTHKKYKVDTINSQDVQTNITYFPGWQAKIDNKKTPIQSQDGRIKLLVPSGQHEIEFTFGGTPIRTLANAISIIALLLVTYIIVCKKEYEKIFS